MLKIHNRRSVKIEYLLMLCVFGFATLAHADEVEEPHTLVIAESEDETFTVMDVEAMSAYRDERRKTLVEALTRSNLGAEHQELIANAMAKVYVGIPVSTFTHTMRTHSSRDDSTESTNTSHVSVAGHIQQEDIEYTSSLHSNSPFLYFPPVPFDVETAKMLDESDSTVTFEFDFDFLKLNEDEDGMPAGIAEDMKWVFEITVNTVNQSPEHITVKLAKPFRKRFLFKMTTLQLDFDYSFIESCGCFAVSRMNMSMKGSALIVGRLDESFELTNTDISCEQPLQFLLPDTQESSFLSF